MRAPLSWFLVCGLFLPAILPAQVAFELAARSRCGVASTPGGMKIQTFPQGVIRTPVNLSVQGSTYRSDAKATLQITPLYTAANPGADIAITAVATSKISTATAGTCNDKGFTAPLPLTINLRATRTEIRVLRLEMTGAVMWDPRPVQVSCHTWFPTITQSGPFIRTKEFILTLKPGDNKFDLAVQAYAHSDGFFFGNNITLNLKARLLPTPSLLFNTYGKACRGSLAVAAPPQFDKPLTVILRGGKTGQYGLLLVGNSDKQYGFLSLPYDLTRIGATGCTLLTNLAGALVLPVDAKGEARATFPLPSPLYAPWFDGFFFQWLHTWPGANPANLVATEAGRLQKK